MKQRLVDGVVVITGGGGEVLFRFVQGNEQQLDILLCDDIHPFASRGLLREGGRAKANQHLFSGIASMQLQRITGKIWHGSLFVLYPIYQHGQQICQLGPQLWLIELFQAVRQGAKACSGAALLPEVVMAHQGHPFIVLSR
ncbi:hypothetical protein D3C75_1021430 [compost metagenome]